MKTESEFDSYSTPIHVFRGRQEMAKYLKTNIPTYQGNPLIEALPGILLTQACRTAFAFSPYCLDEHRSLPKEERFHMVESLHHFFTPLPIHTDLEQRFSRMIRDGYVNRNPMNQNHWRDLRDKVQRVGSCVTIGSQSASGSTGFSLIGVSGAGKTTGVQKVLELYPQVVRHGIYQDCAINRTQIVWLKLACPYDGSTKGLCLNFFQAVDDVLGTRYYQNYGASRRTADVLLPDVANVASVHCLGVLVIDEIQHLSAAKSGGAEKMLNFFVQLVNTVGVPVVLIGTPKARGLLEGEFRQIRRGCGEGYMFWDRMKNDEYWKSFSKALWKCQYVRTPSPWTEELSDALYCECQGITDFAVKMFKQAQIEAIDKSRCDSSETITKGLINRVAHEYFRGARRALNALRSGDEYALSKYEDLMPLDDGAAQNRNTILSAQCASAPKLPQPRIGAVADCRDDLTGFTENQSPRADANAKVSAEQVTPGANPKASNPTLVQQESTMMDIVETGVAKGVLPYDSLKAANIIAATDEFCQS